MTIVDISTVYQTNTTYALHNGTKPTLLITGTLTARSRIEYKRGLEANTINTVYQTHIIYSINCGWSTIYTLHNLHALNNSHRTVRGLWPMTLGSRTLGVQQRQGQRWQGLC